MFQAPQSIQQTVEKKKKPQFGFGQPVVPAMASQGTGGPNVAMPKPPQVLGQPQGGNVPSFGMGEGDGQVMTPPREFRPGMDRPGGGQPQGGNMSRIREMEGYLNDPNLPPEQRQKLLAEYKRLTEQQYEMDSSGNPLAKTTGGGTGDVQTGTEDMRAKDYMDQWREDAGWNTNFPGPPGTDIPGPNINDILEVYPTPFNDSAGGVDQRPYWQGNEPPELGGVEAALNKAPNNSLIPPEDMKTRSDEITSLINQSPLPSPEADKLATTLETGPNINYQAPGFNLSPTEPFQPSTTEGGMSIADQGKGLAVGSGSIEGDTEPTIGNLNKKIAYLKANVGNMSVQEKSAAAQEIKEMANYVYKGGATAQAGATAQGADTAMATTEGETAQGPDSTMVITDTEEKTDPWVPPEDKHEVPEDTGESGATSKGYAEEAGGLVLDQLKYQTPGGETEAITRDDLEKTDVFGTEQFQQGHELGTSALQDALGASKDMAVRPEDNPLYQEELSGIRGRTDRSIDLAMDKARKAAGRVGFGASSVADEKVARAAADAALAGSKEEMSAMNRAFGRGLEERKFGVTSGLEGAGTAFGAAEAAGKLRLGETGQDVGAQLEREGQMTGENVDIAKLSEEERANRARENIQTVGALTTLAGTMSSQDIADREMGLQERIQTGELNLKERSQGFLENTGIRDRDFKEQLDRDVFDLEKMVETGNLDQAQQKIDEIVKEANRRYGLDLNSQSFAQQMGLEDLTLRGQKQQFDQWSDTVDKQLEAAGLEQSDRESIRGDATSRLQMLLNNEVDMAQLGQAERELIARAQAADEQAQFQLYQLLVTDATNRYSAQMSKPSDSFSLGYGDYGIEIPI